MNNVNNVFKSLRREKNFSQKDIAKYLKKTQTTISRWENSDKTEKYITIDIVEKLAKKYDMAPLDLFSKINFSNVSHKS